jgi:hypothetical protein
MTAKQKKVMFFGTIAIGLWLFGVYALAGVKGVILAACSMAAGIQLLSCIHDYLTHDSQSSR